MSPTTEQETAVERLYENEALIDKLTSDVAQPVLQWAEQQILAGADAEAVYAAVRAVNQSGAQDAAAALAIAQKELTPPESKKTDQPPTPAPAEAIQEGKPQSQEAKPADTSAGTVTPPATSTASEPKPPTTETAPVPDKHERPPADKAKKRKTNRSFFQGWSNWLRKNRT